VLRIRPEIALALSLAPAACAKQKERAGADTAAEGATAPAADTQAAPRPAPDTASPAERSRPSRASDSARQTSRAPAAAPDSVPSSDSTPHMSHKPPQPRQAPPMTVPEKTPVESMPRVKLPERRKDYQLDRPPASPDTTRDSTTTDSARPPRE
jgi:hypothetical protein